MAKYLKKFPNHPQYEAYSASTVFMTPNVSYCEQEGDVHYTSSSKPPTPVIRAITYSASSKLEVDLTAFTPAATAETFADGAGKIEFSEPVTEIGYGAFYDKETLRSIDIPDSVTNIDQRAFYRCTNLSSIDMPNSLTTIGNNAFEDCSGLTSVIIPDSVTSLGTYAFTYCYSLSSVTIGTGLTSIGEGVFRQCSGLTSVTIPDSVTSIGRQAFFDCEHITTVTLPSSLTTIGSNAFWNLYALTSITIPSNATSIESQAFMSCTALTSITCEAITPPEIGGNAFDNTNNCPIYVPCESVNDYKEDWSAYASRIQCVEPPQPTTAITYNADNKISIRLNAFTPAATAHTFADGVGKIEFAESVTEIGEAAFVGITSLKSVEIPDSVTSIGNSAFTYCSSLTSVTIPSGVTSIGQYAFESCTILTSITCEATTPPTLGDYAFYNTNNCPIYVPCEKVEAYKEAWSAYETRIQCVTPPTPTSFIAYTASTQLNVDLTAFTPAAISETYDTATHTGVIGFNGPVTAIGQGAFSEKNALTSIVIPDSVTTIGQGAFDSCGGLTSVIIGNGVTSIGYGAFGWCGSITSCTIGSGVTSIDDYAFYNCRSLTSIDIPDSVQTIDNFAFNSCSSLTSVTIGNGVTSINQNAFSRCTSLTSVTIPSDVTSINLNAFSYCNSLTSITCEATTPPTLGNNAFANTNDCPIYVPSASVNTYKTATNWSTYASRIQAKP